MTGRLDAYRDLRGALLHGARLVVAPAHTPTPAELGRLLRNRGVTTLWLTAGLFHEIVDAQPNALRGVRQLLAGGDVLSAPHVRRALASLPETRIVNGYGPTENTTFTTCHAVRADDGDGAPVPIGRPIAGMTVHVLDRGCGPSPSARPASCTRAATASRRATSVARG